jgi:uncharacterized protein (DUF433 family)
MVMRDEELIARQIDPDTRGRGPAEARLLEYGTSVWALMAYLDAVKGDQAAVAADYEIPLGAVGAAIAFYGRHRREIDAKLMANATAQQRRGCSF